MAEFIKEKIIGTWKLVSWTYKNGKGEIIHYFGKDATGILMYDKRGYMNAQLMKAERNLFASASISAGTAPESHEAFHSYLAYYGRYYELNPGEIVHEVEGSLFPNWVGNKQIRYGKVQGDLLILNTPPVPALGTDIVFTVTWLRI
jgi:hypothetical protein